MSYTTDSEQPGSCPALDLVRNETQEEKSHERRAGGAFAIEGHDGAPVNLPDPG
ncbi:MAG TPA: hypothetical protein VGS41_18100 [Chthonomonadales bacterium]|nr:hypothetical protein [Chthonomonadales bacterium]